MSRFTIQQILDVKPWTNAYGTNYEFVMAGLLDDQICPSASINAKDAFRYQAGQTIDVTIESQTQYGVKLKKMPPPAFQAVQEAASVFNPILQNLVPHQLLIAPQVQPQKPADPPVDLRQQSIERQSSLAQAVAYCTAKAVTLSAAKKHDDAVAYLEGKKVLQVATYFKQFVDGRVNVTMTPEEVSHEFGYARKAKDVLLDDPFHGAEEYMEDQLIPA